MRRREFKRLANKCYKYGIPIISELNDIKEAFDCEFVAWDEYKRLYSKTCPESGTNPACPVLPGET